MNSLALYNKIIMIPAMLIAFAFHEFAHAKTADMFGDKTPRFEGRLTLNPMSHIDIVGCIMIFLTGFGWAKPVRTNPSAYKRYYSDDAVVSFAGPAANFFVSILFSIIFALYLGVVQGYLPQNAASVLGDMIQSVIVLNIQLGFFNLLPIPGFDGYHILRDIFKEKFYKFEQRIDKYRILIMLAAVYFAGYIILYPTQMVWQWLVNLIYKILEML